MRAWFHFPRDELAVAWFKLYIRLARVRIELEFECVCVHVRSA